MMKVPVVRNFNQDDVIGVMDIDETKLPKDGRYVFAIGGTASNQELDDFKLIVVSLTHDEQYEAYLQQVKENRVGQSIR